MRARPWKAVAPQPPDEGNHTAPEGQVWVCGACGKRSRDKYGDAALSYGWDESCMMHAVLCYAQLEEV